LVLYELGVLGVGQLATKLVRLQEIQEMEALWISKRNREDIPLHYFLLPSFQSGLIIRPSSFQLSTSYHKTQHQSFLLDITRIYWSFLEVYYRFLETI